MKREDEEGLKLWWSVSLSVWESVSLTFSLFVSELFLLILSTLSSEMKKEDKMGKRRLPIFPSFFNPPFDFYFFLPPPPVSIPLSLSTIHHSHHAVSPLLTFIGFRYPSTSTAGIFLNQAAETFLLTLRPRLTGSSSSLLRPSEFSAVLVLDPQTQQHGHFIFLYKLEY